jgi:hypothetical protein
VESMPGVLKSLKIRALTIMPLVAGLGAGGGEWGGGGGEEGIILVVSSGAHHYVNTPALGIIEDLDTWRQEQLKNARGNCSPL